MKVLVVKTSSLGDLIHTMPALTDASEALPDLDIDWVVEEAFAELCRWHPAVRNVITVAFRRLRGRPITGIFGGPLKNFWREIRTEHYDAIIDAQGLYKSAIITRMARGSKYGFDKDSVRERFAALAYDHTAEVPDDLNVIGRNRRLFAGALGYRVPDRSPDYGLVRAQFERPPFGDPYFLFLRGASWRTKLWPVARWRALTALVADTGFKVCLPWLGNEDRQRAMAVAEGFDHAVTLEIDLPMMGRYVAHAEGVVAVETGFAHLAAALGRPCVTLYGPTSPMRNGTRGAYQTRLAGEMPCAPCRKKQCAYTGDPQIDTPCMAMIGENETWHALRALVLGQDPALTHFTQRQTVVAR